MENGEEGVYEDAFFWKKWNVSMENEEEGDAIYSWKN